VTISVQADTEAEALVWLQRVCMAAGLRQYGRPFPSIGTGRWMVRARPAETVCEGSGNAA
jgi:hypothetical protein